MILIEILDQTSLLLNDNVPNLKHTSVSTTVLDSENLSVWLTKHGINKVLLHHPSEPKQICWQLNSRQMELLAPDGRLVPLSHNECCILKAAALANGNLVSRKMLIEALGQEFWDYDERRLESLISRLRRKMSAYAPEDFSIRSVKGHGYLFKVALQDVGGF